VAEIARPTLRAALAQMCSGDTHDANIAAVTALAAQAARQGAALLCLPEVAGLMNRNGEIARQQVVAAAAIPSSPPAGTLPRNMGSGSISAPPPCSARMVGS
jgi:predicted amidohydrolase